MITLHFYLAQILGSACAMRNCIIPVGAALMMAACDTPATNDASQANEAVQTAAASAPRFRTISGEDVFAMVIPASIEAEQLPLDARQQCGQREFCQVHGWVNEADAAKAMPLTDREVATLSFQYAHNRSTGFERRMWDCERWPRPDANECLPRD